MPEIRELDRAALKKVYQQNLKKDFPLQERRPWSAMASAMKKGRYKAYGYYESGTLLAYAAFYFCRRYPFALLDYYAVVSGKRGQGIGSEFLKKLLPLVPVRGGILIEAENPASAQNKKERKIRERRVAFYKKNGAVKSGITCRLFGVDYLILCCPKHGKASFKGLSLSRAGGIYRDLYGPFSGPFLSLKNSG